MIGAILGGIAGSLAEAYYGIPEEYQETALSYLDFPLLSVVEAFEERYL